MKKLLVLPALGAAAALTYGAASALTVTSAAPLQIGETSGLDCADSAKIVAWGYDDGSGDAFWATVDVKDTDTNCDGNWLYVTPLDDAGDTFGVNGSVTLGNNGTRNNGVTRYQVYFGINADGSGTATGVDAVALSGARVAIDQGWTLPSVGS